ncbi:hypothetical protein EVG20_g8000 [Dentipellis fragilis]|uniref:Uncharacterized protein n=1 Tax=Dentipellis fragilis TaxID=205917 RepID=A0A4Y9YBL5_9AGAM|nr:hypothetical protein EVG20_g8000 [Dentipellis fragilis]
MRTTMGVIKAVIADNADTLEDVAVAGPYMRGMAPLDVRFVPAERRCPRVTRLVIQRLGFDLAAVARTFPNVERLERDCEAALPDDAESGTVWPKLGTLVAPAKVVLPMVAQGNHSMLRCLVIPPSSSAPLRVEDTLDAIRNLRIEELSLSIPSVNLGDPSSDSDDSVLFLAQILESAPHLRKLDLNVHDNDNQTRKVDLATLTPNAQHLTKTHTRVLSQLTYVSLAWPTINTTLTDKTLQSFARPWFTLCPRLACMRLYPSMLEFRWTRRWVNFADCSDNDSDSGVDLGHGDSCPRPRSVVTPHYRCNPKSKQASFDNERTAFAPNDRERGSTAWSAAVCKSCVAPRRIAIAFVLDAACSNVTNSPHACEEQRQLIRDVHEAGHQHNALHGPALNLSITPSAASTENLLLLSQTEPSASSTTATNMVQTIIPGLNEDCAFLTLTYLKTPSLLSMALTSRAAIHPVRLCLVRNTYLTNEEQLIAFLTFVIDHSLESALHHLCILFRQGSTGPETSWSRLLSDILHRATNLSRLWLSLHPSILFTRRLMTPRIETLDGYKRRLFDVLVNYTPALTHLYLYRSEPENVVALQGIRGLTAILLDIQYDGSDTGTNARAPSMDAIKKILADNAETLVDVVLLESLLPDLPMPFTMGELECKLPHVIRLTIRRRPLLFDHGLGNIARIFPNLQRLELDRSMKVSANLVLGPVWRALTTLIAPQDFLLMLARHDDNCPSLQWLVVSHRRGYPHSCLQEILQTVLRFPIYELFLGIPIADLGDPLALRSDLDLTLQMQDPEEPQRTVASQANARLVSALACTFDNLTHLSFFLPWVPTDMSNEILQSLAKAWPPLPRVFPISSDWRSQR